MPITSSTYDQALDRAAELWGIQPDYWDIWGKHHITPAETKRAILHALGVPTGTKEELDEALAARARQEWSRLVAPCLVISQNQRPRQFPLNLPADLAALDARLTLKPENGEPQIHGVPLRDIPVTETMEFNGSSHVRKLVPLPEELPLGYHDLEVLVGGACATTRLIVAPDRAYLPDGLRAAGVAIALYGVRSERNWGCGDFCDLQGVLDWVADQVGASFVALNPLHAIRNRRPYNTSPYLPNSIFYQNWLYLDVEGIPDFAACPRAQRLWAKPEIQQEVAALRATEFVEYERVQTLKMRFLKPLFATFLREYHGGSARAREFQEYHQARRRTAAPLRHLLRTRRVDP